MNHIFYGLAGEGLGHACRTQAVIENLPDYKVHLFTWGNAYDYFQKEGYPYLHRIIGIPFGRSDGKIDSIQTIKNFWHFYFNRRQSVKYVMNEAKKYKPVGFISDFEGVVPQAAWYLNKPLLSIDNQHKFSRTISKGLPLSLRMYSMLMGIYSEWVCWKPDMAIVSTFYHSAVRKKYTTRTMLTNCFMRKQLEQLEPTNGDYVLVYYKVSVGPEMLKALKLSKERVVVFNCPEKDRIEGFEYHNVSNEGFIRALAGCKAVFCAAGNQLLGEAAFYGKPVFTIPEPNQPEQEINSYFIKTLNYGATVSLKQFRKEYVIDFLGDLDKYRYKRSTNGVYEAVDCIRSICC